MRVFLSLLSIFIPLFHCAASCLTASKITLWQQLSYSHRENSLWRIDNKKSYATDNGYDEMAVNLRNNCTISEGLLDLAFSVYGFIYLPVKNTGSFERDSHQSRFLINQLLLSYNVNDEISFEAGKLRPVPGAFFLKSPAKLLNTYYAGFQPTRLYDKGLSPVYEESFWGGALSATTGDYVLSVTSVAKFARIGERYETSGNWSSARRSNTRELYLLSWTDYRLANHTPSLQLLVGDSPGIAFADTFNVSTKVTLNAEFAMHRKQQWRHFSPARAAKVYEYDFSPWLYHEANTSEGELAFGGQYTTDMLSIFGLEYYFQSEGYSESAWRKQIDFINYLNTKTYNYALDRAWDKYKYLMAAEIGNTLNQGMLQKRHYFHVWADMMVKGKASLQPWLIMNMQDGSTISGIHLQVPLALIDDRLEGWIGAFASQGHKNSEFTLFGESLGVYLGFKYFI